MKMDLVRSEMKKGKEKAQKQNPAVTSYSSVTVINDKDEVSMRQFGTDVIAWVEETKVGALKCKADLEAALNDLAEAKTFQKLIEEDIVRILSSKKADSTKIKDLKKFMKI